MSLRPRRATMALGCDERLKGGEVIFLAKRFGQRIVDETTDRPVFAALDAELFDKVRAILGKFGKILPENHRIRLKSRENGKKQALCPSFRLQNLPLSGWIVQRISQRGVPLRPIKTTHPPTGTRVRNSPRSQL